MSRVHPLLLLFTVCGLAASMSAQALRCGTKVITEGDIQIKVLHYCGEPEYTNESVVYQLIRVPWWYDTERRGHRAATDWSTHKGPTRQIEVEVLIEEWIYNFGPHKFMRRIRFKNGYVVRVDTLEYGY